MSDFFSSGWGIFVAVTTVLSLIFCLVLLVVASRREPMAEDNSTGHVWDGDLREMNNPLPRWWMWLFVITVVFSAIYLAFYPGLPVGPTDKPFGGTLGWTSDNQHAREVERMRASAAPLYAQFTSMQAEELAQNEQAMGIGQRLYLNNCAQCHGSDARGSKGFPNLTDGDWLWGGSHEQIVHSISEGRAGNMPALGAAVGGGDNVRNLAHYVMSLSGAAHNSIWAQLGRQHWGTCAACHGADGKGNTALGAPNLTDRIWLHGFGEQAIVSIINNGKVNVMPAQKDRLTEEQIHVLGAYVWGLSRSTTLAAR